MRVTQSFLAAKLPRAIAAPIETSAVEKGVLQVSPYYVPAAELLEALWFRYQRAENS